MRLSEVWLSLVKDIKLIKVTNSNPLSREVEMFMQDRGWEAKVEEKEVFCAHLALPPLWFSFSQSVFSHQSGEQQGGKEWYRDLSLYFFEGNHSPGFLTRVI